MRASGKCAASLLKPGLVGALRQEDACRSGMALLPRPTAALAAPAGGTTSDAPLGTHRWGVTLPCVQIWELSSGGGPKLNQFQFSSAMRLVALAQVRQWGVVQAGGAVQVPFPATPPCTPPPPPNPPTSAEAASLCAAGQQRADAHRAGAGHSRWRRAIAAPSDAPGPRGAGRCGAGCTASATTCGSGRSAVRAAASTARAGRASAAGLRGAGASSGRRPRRLPAHESAGPSALPDRVHAAGHGPGWVHDGAPVWLGGAGGGGVLGMSVCHLMLQGGGVPGVNSLLGWAAAEWGMCV